MADVLTQTGTMQSMYPTSGDCPNGSGTRYCGHRASRPCWRRATDCFPITWTGGTDPSRSFVVADSMTTEASFRSDSTQQ